MVRVSLTIEEALWAQAKEAAIEEKRAAGAPGRATLNALMNKALGEYLLKHHGKRGGR